MQVRFKPAGRWARDNERERAPDEVQAEHGGVRGMGVERKLTKNEKN